MFEIELCISEKYKQSQEHSHSGHQLSEPQVGVVAGRFRAVPDSPELKTKRLHVRLFGSGSRSPFGLQGLEGRHGLRASRAVRSFARVLD